ncbi:MAG: hypothetical protein V2A54_00020 [Bacteroidota bacterium]
MKKLLLFGISVFLFSGFTFAQTKQTGPLFDKLQGVKSEKTRGGDPNIKIEKRVNGDAKESFVIQPSTKGSDKPNSVYCDLVFDNWTNYYVNCYVAGNMEGYVSPWGKSTITVAGGDTKVYVVAELSDGSRMTWGPSNRYCYNQEWTVYVQ